MDKAGDCTGFVLFMLQALRETLEDTPQVTPQVAMLLGAIGSEGFRVQGTFRLSGGGWTRAIRNPRTVRTPSSECARDASRQAQ